MWPYIDSSKFEHARAADPNLWTFIYAWAIFTALVLYLGFLRYLPKLVGKDDEHVPEAGFVIPLVREGTQTKPTEQRKTINSRKRKRHDDD